MRLGNLLKISIPYFTSDEIRSNFNIIWENIDLIPFNEKFFIENYDLIDHKKLLCLVDWERSLEKSEKMVEYYEKSWRWNPSASFLYEVKIRRHDVHFI